jgi:hypothetical protein
MNRLESENTFRPGSPISPKSKASWANPDRIVSDPRLPHLGVPTFNVIDTQAGDRNLADLVVVHRPGPAGVGAA